MGSYQVQNADYGHHCRTELYAARGQRLLGWAVAALSSSSAMSFFGARVR